MVSYEILFRELHDQNIEYMIVGGIAVNLHGYPRFTNDLDILLALDKDNIKKLSKIMQSLDYEPRLPVSIEVLEDEDTVKSFIEEKGMTAYSYIHKHQPQFNVDILVAESQDYANFTKEKMPASIWDIEVPVVCIDDLIAMKKIVNPPLAMTKSTCVA